MIPAHDAGMIGGVFMKIITISREFGSGGRELGTRLSELMHIDYYDREIISKIAKNTDMDENYAEYILNGHSISDMPISVRHSFSIPSILQSVQIDLLRNQKKVIEEIATAGRDCIIVGRNADVLLEEYDPFTIFVCASLDSKIRRCRERASEDENMTDKQIIKNIKLIDKNRKRTREMLSDSGWGECTTYNLTVNTTGWDIKDLVPHVAGFINGWYESRGEQE